MNTLSTEFVKLQWPETLEGVSDLAWNVGQLINMKTLSESFKL